MSRCEHIVRVRVRAGVTWRRPDNACCAINIEIVNIWRNERVTDCLQGLFIYSEIHDYLSSRKYLIKCLSTALYLQS